FPRQHTKGFTHANALRRLPTAEGRARLLQTLREQISAPLAAFERVAPARRVVGQRVLLRRDCVEVQFQTMKLPRSLARGRPPRTGLSGRRNRRRPPEQVE